MEQTTRAHKPNRPLLSFDNDNVYAALTYKGKRTEIKISPHSVSLASPVWKKALLFPTLPVMQNDGPKPLPDSLNDSKSELAHEQPELDNKDPEQPKLDDKDLEQPELDDKDLDEFELVGDSLGSTGSLDYPTHGTEDQYGQDQKQVTARKILDLTEDDAESILLLLRIAHLQFHKIPRKLSFCSLVEVAILCDYYDCINLVRPWYEPWLENTAVESQKPGQEMWLLIAHVFGEWKVFRELATKLVQEVTTNDKLECLTASGKVLTVPLPLDIVESLLSVRQTTIKRLLNGVYSYANRFIRSADYENTICCKANPKECDALVYGSLVMSFQSAALWPPVEPQDIEMSINELVSTLLLVEPLTMPRNGSHHRSYDHTACGVADYKETIDRALASITIPVLDNHRRRMTSVK